VAAQAGHAECISPSDTLEDLVSYRMNLDHVAAAVVDNKPQKVPRGARASAGYRWFERVML
jgi:hypothetical protein